MTKRIHSFVWGTLAALSAIGFGIYSCADSGDFSSIWVDVIIALMLFSFVSCLILNNNFIGEMMLGILSWGFVKMPGVIFTLDLDGLIWLLTVKLLFWVLGFILAIICGILAVIVGLVVSVFVYPFALYRSIRYGDDYID